MIQRFILAWLSIFACAPLHAGPKEEALAAYQRFFELFTADNHDEVASLFAPVALFYGTASAEVVTSPEGIRQYFLGALDGSRGKVSATLLSRTVLVLSDDVVAIAGQWQLERISERQAVVAGPLRNTVVMQNQGDGWLIVQFHNSSMLQPPAAKPASGP
ncbi:MAG: nuclear transport factor 2 family protein [Chromatiales bacterium]|nr:nuclear transport factor 2 family protein [Chromatiales bacterium]